MKKHFNGRFLSTLVLLVMFVSCFSAVSFADTEDTKTPDTDVRSYKTYVTVSESNVYSYDEVISVRINEDNAEYVRQLPKKYIGRIDNVRVEGYDFYFDDTAGTISINAGESGLKNFTIKYTVQGTNNLGKKKDRFNVYFLNGSECSGEDTIEKASFRLKCADSIEWNEITVHAGDSTSEENDCGSWHISEADKVLKFSSDHERGIKSGEVVRVSAEFPKGFWSNASEIGWTRSLSLMMFFLGIFIFIVMRITLGREKDIIVTRTPFPPYNMDPLRMGYLADGYVDDRDVVAQLLHLGEEGYYNIIEYEKFKYKFEYVEYPANENQASKLLFNAIFHESSKPGDIVLLDDVAPKLRKVIPSVRRRTARYFRGGRAAFTTSSRLGNRFVRLVYAVIVAVLPVMNYSYHIQSNADFEKGLALAIGWALGMTFLLSRVCIEYMKLQRKQVDGNRVRFWVWSVIYITAAFIYSHMFRFAIDGRNGDMTVQLTAILFLILAPIMLFGFRTRGAEAADRYGRVQGFVQYVRDAKGSELKHTAGTDGKYFFRVLPYAYIFGISKKLASNFQNIDVPAPSWYRPYGVSKDYEFDVVIMNAMLRNFEQGIFSSVFQKNLQ